MTTPSGSITTRANAGALAASLPQTRRWVEPVLILAFWTVMAVFTFIGISLDPRTGKLQPMIPGASAGMAFSGWYLWAALTPPIFWLSRRYGLERGSWRSRMFVLLGAGVLIAICVEVVISYLRFEVFYRFPGQPIAFDPFWGMRRLAWLDDLVVYFAILAAGFARDYFLRLQARSREAVALQARAVQLQAEAARLEAQLAEARLSALRAQLDPHFLFNTLNAVSSLVGSDPRGVRRMIARLSVLLRHSLEESPEPEVALEDELQVLTQYVEIMEIRFEGRLHVEKRVEPNVLDALVPNLILQPIVENAIKHGVSKLPNSAVGHIEVTARRDGDDVVISVVDNGPALEDTGEMFAERGVGVRNTRARLAQLYGTEHTLSLSRGPGGEGVVATLRVPYHTRADLHAAAPTGSASDMEPATTPVAAGSD
jgi:two-component system LytT family sensor kinase